MKYSEKKKKNYFKNYEVPGVKLLNLVGGTRVPLLYFDGEGCWGPSFKLYKRGSRVPGFRDSGSRGPGPTFTILCQIMVVTVL